VQAPIEESEPAPPAQEDTLWDPSQVIRPAPGRPAPAAHGRTPIEEPEELPYDTVFTRAMPISLLVAGALWLLSQTFFTQNVFNFVPNADEAYAQFRQVTGFDAPPGQQEGVVLTWTGRRIILLDEASADAPTEELELSVWAFHQGRLAGAITRAELLDAVENLLTRQIRDSPNPAPGVQADLWRVSEREYSLHSHPATLRILAAGARRGNQRGEGMRIACLAFIAPDGRPAMLVIAGPVPRVTSVVRTYLRTMGR
jgi:hypothetical protein